MKRKLFYLLFCFTLFDAFSQEKNEYKFSNLITPKANGLYVWEYELKAIEQFRTVNWRLLDINISKKIAIPTIIAVSTGNKRTVFGISTDGFSVSKSEFLKWDISKISDGIFIDSSGNKYIRFSKTNPYEGLEIGELLAKLYWKILKNDFVIEGESLFFIETGIFFNDENYDLLWDSSIFVKNGMTVFQHKDIDLLNFTYILSKYENGKMTFYRGELDNRILIPRNVIGKSYKK